MKVKNTISRKRLHATLRAGRIRSRLHGTAARPRLTVKRSLKHIYAQLIDDVAARTLVAFSDTHIKEFGKPLEIARRVGKRLAEAAREKGIEEAVFDRGSYRYHGRVAALADGARDGGLNF